ncbi:MAG: D-glycero-beta-D-manno-heptose 1,7-bisphosphate 7-phosphatase [Gammaproteobacteria bacterium]|nr:D-glycero-beta-D-manno-heptose 1,7-bisphosphate 7-phosphatase [Gammaproteobacteria bacterium]
MKLLILDRDGVINLDSDHYIKSVAEWIPLESSLDAIARLTQAGWTVAVATNQSGIGRGYYGWDELQAMHERLDELLAQRGSRIAHIEICPHAPDEGCECRKPAPGMLNAILRRYGVPAHEVFFVGDKNEDVECALAAGCKPVLVRTGKGERSLLKGGLPADLPVFADLAAFTAWLLQHHV